MSSKAWSGLSSVAVLGSVAVAKKGLDTSWRAATGKPPPAKGSDEEMVEAVIFAMLSAAFLTIVRIVVSRRAADYVARSTSSPRN
jgi:Protein of unknown function (DUF4235)